MNSFLIFIFGVIAGGVAVWLLFSNKRQSQHSNILENVKMSKKTQGLISKQAREKEENKQKIIKFFESRDKATNDDIEALLGVSDATATRYLGELEKESHIRQVGKTGKYVYYEKTK